VEEVPAHTQSAYGGCRILQDLGGAGHILGDRQNIKRISFPARESGAEAGVRFRWAKAISCVSSPAFCSGGGRGQLKLVINCWLLVK